MSHFNKFLDFNEELCLVIKLRSKSLLFYIIVFIGFPAVFFMLYPMSIRGRQGFALWLSLIFILIIMIYKILFKQTDCYLLTTHRLLHLTLKNKIDYQKKGTISLAKIKKIKKKGLHNICLQTKKRNFILTNIQNRDLVYKKLIKFKQDFVN